MTRFLHVLGRLGRGLSTRSGSVNVGTPSAESRRLFRALAGPDGRERTLFQAVVWSEAALEGPVARSPHLRGRKRRVLAVGVTLPVVALLASVVAFAYFTSSGAGTGSASVGTLDATTITTHTAAGNSVSLDWSTVTAPGGGSVSGYYVLRNGLPASPACGSYGSPIPAPATSCTDTAPTVGSPSTYTYTVVTKWRSWTSTSAAASVLVRGSQAITFTSTAPAAAKVGGSTYTVTATGGASGNAVTFTIDAAASAVCSIAGSSVSFTAAGSCVVNANQAGNGNYNAAPQVQQSFTVAKGDQAITFTSTAPASAKVGGVGYTPTATATSGLAVVLTIDASSSSVCSIAGGVVSFTAVGTCLVDANQAGNGNWNPAAQAQQSFTVAKGDQAITFTSTAPAAAKVGGSTYTVTATGGASGNAVTFTIDAAASAVCSIAGSTVSFTAAGSCVVNANQAGNGNYNAAPQVQQSFTVAKGDQTITFGAIAAKTFDQGPLTVSASATSGLAVVFTSSTTGVCTVSGTTVTFVSGAAATCTIDANQAGNANWNAATQVSQSFTINKGNQTITFGAIAAKTFDQGPLTVSASASSGLAVVFTSSTTGVCTVSGTTVTFVSGAAATCTIDANQAGNANWNAATQVSQSFTINKGNQTITFTSTNPSPVTFGGSTYTPTATATSGLTVAITLDAASTGCSLSGGVVSFTAAGTCVIDANQAGNANWNAAPQAQQSITVSAPVFAITAWTRTNGNIKGTFSGTGGTAGSTVTVTICATNTFPSCSALTTTTATVAANGTWTTGNTANNISSGSTFYARAVQGSPAKTSAVFTFTA